MQASINKASAVVALLAITLLGGGCAAFTEHRTGVVDGRLTACPEWPRCVSSQAQNPDKQVAPYAIKGDTSDAWQAAKAAVAGMQQTTIVKQRDNYLHAEIISPWHFYTDDLELLLQAEQGLIQVRSSGRIGYYDFQVNRDRVEALRTQLIEQGVLESAQP